MFGIEGAGPSINRKSGQGQQKEAKVVASWWVGPEQEASGEPARRLGAPSEEISANETCSKETILPYSWCIHPGNL
jgi:hypothetical protein